MSVWPDLKPGWSNDPRCQKAPIQRSATFHSSRIVHFRFAPEGVSGISIHLPSLAKSTRISENSPGFVLPHQPDSEMVTEKPYHPGIQNMRNERSDPVGTIKPAPGTEVSCIDRHPYLVLTDVLDTTQARRMPAECASPFTNALRRVPYAVLRFATSYAQLADSVRGTTGSTSTCENPASIATHHLTVATTFVTGSSRLRTFGSFGPCIARMVTGKPYQSGVSRPGSNTIGISRPLAWTM